MDLLSAEDELGVALLRENAEGANTLKHINNAIGVAPQGLMPKKECAG